MFNGFSIGVNLAIFCALAGIVWLAGTRLSYLIDAIAEQTQIARAFLGLILLATATELPEFVTTITASSSGNGTLALNNMFGGMLMQLAVLSAADWCVKDGTLCAKPHKPNVAVAGLLCIVPMAAVLIASLFSDWLSVSMFGAQRIGLGSLVVGVLYLIAMYLLKTMQGRDTWSAVDLPDEQRSSDDRRENKFDDKSRSYLISFSIVCALE
ncbi:hypothetical protein [Alteromonas oceanisediminis]|uniref:hypothetical protein n=1 Tax=Alteromonas oceanisediminis TaxID=2836180 RepID=UPI001BDB2AC2|nr:hypothetical protein [Alteromonas oceanisediminis]MBT0585163.1 hypothetical protein [Alteromonas oceanisediminis]